MKYPKPKILMMDIERDASLPLVVSGYNVMEGSFGRAYHSSESFCPVYINAKLPKHYKECEIVVIDLKPMPPLKKSDTSPVIKSNQGEVLRIVPIFDFVDPRPVIMSMQQEACNRIYAHGGVFIVFVSPRTTPDGSDAGSWTHSIRSHYDHFNSWSFLEILEKASLTIIPDEGHEIKVDVNVSKDLASFLENGSYLCTLEPSPWLEKEGRWQTLATNKYGAIVSGVIAPEANSDAGLIILAPQVEDKAGFIQYLLVEALPKITPNLFPYLSRPKWIDDDLYQTPGITELQAEIEKIRQDTAEKIAAVEQSILHLTREHQYLKDLISETGDKLVDAVKKSLEVLGFISVIDADRENDQEERKSEDLRIEDREPFVLIEVKGVNSVRENAVMQIAKYLFPRSIDLGTNKIRGLSIVNHERHVPAVQRAVNPFTKEIVINAHGLNFGLMTAWNLYRLVRNFLKFDWRHENIEHLFYQNGIVDIVPKNYVYVGVIEEFWPRHSAVGIKIENDAININDLIAFEATIEFELQKVESLQINKTPSSSATIGNLAGILTALPATKLKKGTRVFRIIPEI